MSISRNIKAAFFKLIGTRNEHQKRNKMTPIVTLWMKLTPYIRLKLTFIIANTIANRFGTKANSTAQLHPNRQR